MPYAYRYPSSRSFYYSRFPPGVKWLIISNTAVFVLYFFATAFNGNGLFRHLMLWPSMVLQHPLLSFWQLFTYLFLHGGFFHLLFNMFALWMFGTDLERDWGTKPFLKYYFLCGVGAGVCVVVANAFGGPSYPTIGSSGAIYGVLLAFGVLYPDRIILFSFLFPIKAKYFVMIIGVIAFMSSLGAAGSGVSHVAHLGGMVFGYVFLKRRLWRFEIMAPLARQYNAWRRQRAKKKFQLYMRKEESKRDRWVN